ncbi:hypothetical protein [Methylobacterium planeticum]|uniref:Uncharacterized protein n=1 Tax=Methylobacterium planeticum TaxID=2615211 RepID=A0A6N6MQJ0_9HYPH|nr:hypothetical protein [Methylobacterium planeticum]KAB1072603.1 hypothetical protein F6X51_15035 [Methylobacterium planeticum]
MPIRLLHFEGNDIGSDVLRERKGRSLPAGIGPIAGVQTGLLQTRCGDTQKTHDAAAHGERVAVDDQASAAQEVARAAGTKPVWRSSA